jgi:hypothetical protein
MKNGAPTSITCSFTNFNACVDLTHQEFFAAGDVISVRVVRTGTGTGIWNANVAVTLATPLTVAQTSPVLSFYDDGAQVAFVQRVGTAASLVLLKWSGRLPGTVGEPTTPPSVAPTAYRAAARRA